MTIKLITYDLNQPNKNYDSLYKEIKSLGDCINPLKSVWLVKTNLSSSDIRSRLQTVADANDGFIVVPFAINRNSEYDAYLDKEDIAWIERNI